MPSRPISRSSISFGLVSIPVEVFPATASKSVHFNLLHAKDNSRIQERIYCVSENKAIDRSELVHGFQIQKVNTFPLRMRVRICQGLSSVECRDDQERASRARQIRNAW